MNCPLCVDQVLEPNYRAGIEIDVCPHCKGVWLDRGELDKLAASGGRAVVQDTMVAPASSTSGKDTKKSSEKKPDKKSSKKSKQKKKKKSSFGDRLGDILEDVLDL